MDRTTPRYAHTRSRASSSLRVASESSHWYRFIYAQAQRLMINAISQKMSILFWLVIGFILLEDVEFCQEIHYGLDFGCVRTIFYEHRIK
jgi:hypothetical protein